MTDREDKNKSCKLVDYLFLVVMKCIYVRQTNKGDRPDGLASGGERVVVFYDDA